MSYWIWSRDVDHTTIDDELDLPEADHDGYDQYAEQSDRLRLWATSVDESPEWEREADATIEPCGRCHRTADLDPWGTCADCRVTAGWCKWCGLDRPAYRKLTACRTCYRWLRRHSDLTDRDAAPMLLSQAVQRKTNRERRSA